MPRHREQNSTLRRSLRLAAILVASALSAGLAHAQEAIIEAEDIAAASDASIGVFVRDSAVAADKLALAQRMERAQEWDTSAEVYQEVLDGFADRVVATHFDAQGRPDRYGGVTSVIRDRISAWPEAGREVYVARYGTRAQQMLDAAAPGDRNALARIADRYFVTEAGRDASLQLVELHFAAGEFAAAASMADRLLDIHPALSTTDRPLLLLRSVIAWRLAGEPNRAKPRAETLAKEFADARAILGGQERSLAEVAAADLARPVDPAAGTIHAESGGWRMPFGSSDHAAVAVEPDAPARSQPPREWGKLLSFDLAPSPASIAETDEEMASLRALIQRQRDLGATTGILPSVDGTQLFFQDNARVYARDLATGAPLPGWLESYPGDNGAYKTDANAAPRGAQMTVTLTDDRVLAIVGQTDGLAGMSFGEEPQTQRFGARLVCLDRATGKPVWTRRMSDAATAKAAMDAKNKQQAADAGKPADANTPVDATAAQPAQVQEPQPAPARRRIIDRRRVFAPNAIPGENAPRTGDESLRQTEPRGSALVVGDSVYIVARGGEMGSFEDCYLVSFALADGEFRWARHLASGNASQMNFNGYPQSMSAADSHLACVDGRIFVSTDMGAIAAVNAADGSLAWLSLYPRPRPTQQNQWVNPNNVNGPRVKPAFEGNPVIVRDGKVLTLPADGEHLFVHDLVTGQEIARVPTKWRQDENYNLVEGNAQNSGIGVGTEIYNVLVGLAGDRLVIASPQSVSTLDWSKLRAGNADQNANVAEFMPRDLVLQRKVIRGPGFEDVAIRGRPFVTDRSVYVPTAWALFRLDLENFVTLERYPANDGWQNRGDEAPGNVTVVNGNVIVAGPERVAVYAGLGLVRQRLEAAIASAPDAIAPRLRYAEAMANAGRNDEAMKWIDEAAMKLPANAAPDHADRAALFNACATLVRDLNRPGRSPDAAFQSRLLTTLATAAGTPVQQVTARLLRGGLAAQAKDYPAAVEAFQALIEEPTWAAMQAKVGSEPTPIATIASGALKVLLGTAEGRAAYAAIEARAAAELERATAEKDAMKIFAVAERFPNARAAEDAVTRSADMLTTTPGQQPQLGIAALRKMAAGITEPAARVALDDAMLRAYLAVGDVPAALGRARRIAWAEPDRAIESLPSIDGMPIVATAASEVVAELQKRHFDQQDAALPDLKANLDGDSFDVDKTVAIKNVASLLAPEPLTKARPDRVVTILQNRDLAIFNTGEREPRSRITLAGVNDRTSVTWLPGERLLLRQLSRVACVDVEGKSVAWTFDPARVPSQQQGPSQVASILIDDADLIALAPKPAAMAPVVAMSPEQQQIEAMIRQGNMDPLIAQRMVLQQQRQRRAMALQMRAGVANGRMIGNGWDPDPRPEDNAKEAVAEAMPVARDTLIAVATTRGRLCVLDARNGEIKWQAQVSDRAPGSFRVVGDLIVLATTDESSSRVIAFDAATGKETLRRTGGNGPGRVCNLGVSDEGWLSVVTGNGVQLFDLLGGGREPLSSITVNGDFGQPPFGQSRDASHIQFVGGRLLVLADNVAEGSQGTPTVRSYELPALTATKVSANKTKQPLDRRFLPKFAKDQRLGNEQIELTVHRDQLYISTGQFMTAYAVFDEDPTANAWSRLLPELPSTLSMQSPMLVKDAMIIVGWPNEFIGQTAPAVRAELYNRRTHDGKHESGMCVADPELSVRGGKVGDKFQPVTGGLYYWTTDNTLRFLPGRME